MNTITLLNCFYREDVITDMIANLMNKEEKFAKWFVETICEVSCNDSKVIAQTRVGLGKGIGTPDLVIKISGTTTDMVLVIENKLGALEGFEQTNRYASAEGKGRLLSSLNVDQDVPVQFLFLTLDPYTAAANLNFAKKDYRRFIDVDFNTLLRDEAAIRIMTDYSELLKDFYLPLLEVKLEDDIENTTQNLDSLQKKLTWIHILQEANDQLPDGFKMKSGEAGGFGRNAAVFLFTKDNWKQDYFNGVRLSPHSANIHFELSVDLLTFTPVSDFALHYEPNPYKPKNKYSTVEGYKEYELLRKKRRESFHHSVKEFNEGSVFTLRTGSNSILRINLSNNKSFEEVVRELIARMEQLTPYIDEFLNFQQ